MKQNKYEIKFHQEALRNYIISQETEKIMRNLDKMRSVNTIYLLTVDYFIDYIVSSPDTNIIYCISRQYVKNNNGKEDIYITFRDAGDNDIYVMLSDILDQYGYLNSLARLVAEDKMKNSSTLEEEQLAIVAEKEKLAKKEKQLKEFEKQIYKVKSIMDDFIDKQLEIINTDE